MFTINLKRSATVLAVTAGLLTAVPAGASAADRDGSVPRPTLKSDGNEVAIEGRTASVLDYHGEPVVTLIDYIGQTILT